MWKKCRWGSKQLLKRTEAQTCLNEGFNLKSIYLLYLKKLFLYDVDRCNSKNFQVKSAQIKGQSFTKMFRLFFKI